MNNAPPLYQVMPPLSADERSALKSDISERGVLVPVEYDEIGNILDGHHRVELCGELGITHWPRLIRYGMTEREKFTHARRLNINRRHLSREQRQAQIEAELKQSPEASDRKIAEGLGVDHKTIGVARDKLESTGEIPQLDERTGKDQRVRRVVQYVDPSPEGIRGSKLTAKTILKAERDANSEGRTNLQRALSDRSAELSGGRKVPVIYADPATRFLAGLGPKSTENHYKTMTTEELCDLSVGDRALPSCELYIWSTVPQLVNTIKIANAWGFPDYSSHMVWDKTSPDHPREMGPGYVFRNQHELLLRFTRGSPVGPKIKPLSIYRERKREHSRKPDYFRQMIIDMTRGLPTIELFARVDAEHPLPKGWESWGNQAAPHDPDDHIVDANEKVEVEPGRIEVTVGAGNPFAEILQFGDVSEERLEECIAGLLMRDPPVPADKITRIDALTGEIIAPVQREDDAAHTTLNGGYGESEGETPTERTAARDASGREFMPGGLADPAIAELEDSVTAEEEADIFPADSAEAPADARTSNTGGDHEDVTDQPNDPVLNAGAAEMPTRAVSKNRAAPAQSARRSEDDGEPIPEFLRRAPENPA